MSIEHIENNDLNEAPVCSKDGSKFKCAIVSWVMPLIAILILWLALSYPALKVLNILVLGFGVTALIRSVAHIRRYGGCGLRGHVYVGATLNIIIVSLFIMNVFFGVHYS
jgi:hypothetical protein